MHWRQTLGASHPDTLCFKDERSIVDDAFGRLDTYSSTNFVNETYLATQADLSFHSIMNVSPGIVPIQLK
jgi:hypothetical protein